MHRRPIEPEPECPDPGRRERIRVRTMRLVELMLAPVNREAELVDRRRVREIEAGEEQLVEGAADRGPTGPAAMARPRGIETVTDDVWVEAGARRYSRTDVMRYRDGVLEHYAAAGILTGTSLDAAIELARLYRHARATMAAPGPALCQYGAPHGGRRPSESQEDFEARVWRDFNQAVDHLPRGSVSACVDVARGLFPTGTDAVWHMQTGFEALASYWRLRKATQNA
ncbi:hypothetical protein HMPREF9946_02216 [Acetobacteraceae bacterium AT-5844]|nr:hypothetical protein HMPREF9946_02216 [Acetobacteraceae bacterium AT-5844]